MVNKKLKQNELKQIQEIQARMTTVEQQLGQVALVKINLQKRTDNITNYLEETQEMERNLAVELEEKYGRGSIDLQNGEFIPSQVNNTQEVVQTVK